MSYGPPSYPPYGLPPAGGSGFPPTTVPPPPPPPAVLPPPPNSWEPDYPAWYHHQQQMQWGHHSFAPPPPPPGFGGGAGAIPIPPGPPPFAPPPIGGMPLPPGLVGHTPPPGSGGGEEPPAAKKLCIDLTQPPPPPPVTSSAPAWQAARRGAVIYETPRQPTPEPPSPPAPPPPVFTAGPASPVPGELPPPPVVPAKPKMQWWYDGQSWVYADKQPEMREPEPAQPEFEYTYAGKENPVANAVMANLRGKFRHNQHHYNKEDKPKAVPVRCETCSLTVTCQKTYETHINGKAHKKRIVQMEKLKVEEAKKAALTKAKIEAAKARVEAQLEGKPLPPPQLKVEEGQKEPEPEIDLENPLQPVVGTGELRCILCNVKMNSKECANSHLLGTKHKKVLDKYKHNKMKYNRGGMSNRGGRVQPAVSKITKVELAAALSQPVKKEKEEETTTKPTTGSAAAATAAVKEEPAEGEEQKAGGDASWPPRGITIISEPSGDSAGSYRCELCQVHFTCERNLQCHLVAPQHQDSLTRSTDLHGPNRGPIWRAAPNAANTNAVRAQRGRRGLISYGEAMPEKLTKSQKKAQPNNIADLIQQSIDKQGGTMKVMPLLMSFVRGETIQADRHFVSGDKPSATKP